MNYTFKYQKIAKWIVMTILFVILTLGYIFQYQLSMTMTGMNNYEQINCNLFDNSLPDFQAEQDEWISKYEELGDAMTINDATIDNADIQLENDQDLHINGFSRILF
jgi:hypothetical protein